MERWVVAAKRADFAAIGKEFGIDPVIARLIRNRDVQDRDEIRRYLYGKVDELASPHLMKDVDKAVEILRNKIKEKKRIRIIGDYDIDGVVSTFILKRADEQTLFPLVVKHRADIGRQVFQIPLVDQAIDLTRFFIRSIVCVHMVNDSNEPNARLNKLSVQVFFHEFHIAGKTGLRLGQHHIKFMFACSLYHRIESRTVPIDAGIILIRINLVNIKSFLNGVLNQHRFLVLNTFRFANFIFIFFAQAAINCRFHDLHLSFCAQSSMRNIPHSPLKFKDAKSGAGF